MVRKSNGADILTGSEAEIGTEACRTAVKNKQVTHLTILIVILKSKGPTTIGASHSILKRLTSAE